MADEIFTVVFECPELSSENSPVWIAYDIPADAYTPDMTEEDASALDINAPGEQGRLCDVGGTPL